MWVNEFTNISTLNKVCVFGIQLIEEIAIPSFEVHWSNAGLTLALVALSQVGQAFSQLVSCYRGRCAESGEQISNLIGSHATVVNRGDLIKG